ncbi:roadblock/LC7 domain-containing protein [Streptomyces odontomachi]|uniref:roadblock/LC7 domain-containing protein n=1 Tax=Streptomyces odontomachi TaxID=2944940 RepID=UPI002108A051|nr:roadblock/LC7 domain-containing protein [Streptomyces sp. ODS25]
MTKSPDVSWILDELVKAPHARHAVLLSADGLQRAASQGVHTDMADRVSAIASGMQSLSRNGADFVSEQETAWQQTMVQFEDGFLFVIAAADGAYLVASAGPQVDISAFSYDMAKMVSRLGDELVVEPRQQQAGRP